MLCETTNLEFTFKKIKKKLYNFQKTFSEICKNNEFNDILSLMNFEDFIVLIELSLHSFVILLR